MNDIQEMSHFIQMLEKATVKRCETNEQQRLRPLVEKVFWSKKRNAKMKFHI